MGVHTCQHQLISLLYLKHPSSYLFKPSLIDFILCLFRILDQCSLILKLVPKCIRKLCVGRIQIGQIALLLPQVFGRLWRGLRLCDITYCHQLIYCLQFNYPKFVQFIGVCITSSNYRRIIHPCFGV